MDGSEATIPVDAVPATAAVKPAKTTRRGWELIYRHTIWVRLAHWVNVLCILVLLMSGMQIFNAHSSLYWGKAGNEGDTPLFTIYAEERLEGPPQGWVKLGDWQIETTGWFGVFTDRDGYPSGRAFPYWLTLPSYGALAEGRRWHLFFALLFALNGLAYWIYGFWVRHFQRDLAPNGKEFRHIPRAILDHLVLKRPRGEDAKRYNVLQKLTYIGVIFVLLPLMIVTGISMSPGIDSAAHWLPDLFGGRQSARTVHFIAATLIVLFVLVHVIEVLLSGPFNEMRSIITGWFAVRPEKTPVQRSET
jgi:thiosulfate reductase cytochrome b subunit